MYLVLSFVSCCGAIGCEHVKSIMIQTGCGQRYYYVPNIIFLLLILRVVGDRCGRGMVATVVLVLSIGLGMAEYKDTLIRSADWPNWKQEVQTWRKKPRHRIAIWPAGWYVELR